MTDHTISRRRLLGSSAAAGLGAMLGRVPGASAATASSLSADVVVVGAGFAKFLTFDEGDNVYVNSQGQRSTYSDTGPLGTAPPDPLILADLTQVVVRLDDMSTEVPVGAPWQSSQVGDWDGQ